MPSPYDQFVSTLTITRTYKSNSSEGYGVALKGNFNEDDFSTSEKEILAGNPDTDKRQFLNQFKAALAKRLHLPEGIFYDGISHGEIRISPATKKVGKEELQKAVQEEINAAKARVAGKKVGANIEISGGVETDGIALQAGAKNTKPIQVG